MGKMQELHSWFFFPFLSLCHFCLSLQFVLRFIWFCHIRVQKVLYQHYGPSWRQELPAHSLLMAPLPQQSQPTPAVNLTGTQLKVGDPTGKRPDGPEVGNGSEAGHAQKQEKSRTPESDVKSSPEKNRKEEELPKKKISPEENFQKLKAEGNDFVKKVWRSQSRKIFEEMKSTSTSGGTPINRRSRFHFHTMENASLLNWLATPWIIWQWQSLL